MNDKEKVVVTDFFQTFTKEWMKVKQTANLTIGNEKVDKRVIALRSVDFRLTDYIKCYIASTQDNVRLRRDFSEFPENLARLLDISLERPCAWELLKIEGDTLQKYFSYNQDQKGAAKALPSFKQYLECLIGLAGTALTKKERKFDPSPCAALQKEFDIDQQFHNLTVKNWELQKTYPEVIECKQLLVSDPLQAALCTAQNSEFQQEFATLQTCYSKYGASKCQNTMNKVVSKAIQVELKRVKELTQFL